MDNIKRIAITTGEPAGIGPDLVVELAQLDWPVELVACGDPDLLKERAKLLGKKLTLKSYNPTIPATAQQAGTLTIAPFSLLAPVELGKLNVKNSSYVTQLLSYAGSGCLEGKFDAVVTGPVHKGIIIDDGCPFSGQTEFFANQANCQDVVMMLANDEMNVALATTHIPLAYVSKAITRDRLHKVIKTVNKELIEKFGVAKPNIYVCGLNPHAGEGGHLGKEEIDTIIPALDELREEGIVLTGPLAADTIFQQKYLQDADVILAMYHDQGLPVLKTQGFGKSVNITLGLPYVRTSVDHGTALELAGSGKADAGSFIYALNKAIKLIHHKTS